VVACFLPVAINSEDPHSSLATAPLPSTMAVSTISEAIVFHLAFDPSLLGVTLLTGSACRRNSSHSLPSELSTVYRDHTIWG